MSVVTAAYLALIGLFRLPQLQSKQSTMADWLLVVVPILFALLVLGWGSGMSLHYPVVVTMVFFTVFMLSLFGEKTVIQIMAERWEKEPLDHIQIQYMRNLTKVWCVFFVINGAIAMHFAWRQQLEAWTIYTGAVSYLLVAMLFVGEKLVRSYIQKFMRSRVK